MKKPMFPMIHKLVLSHLISYIPSLFLVTLVKWSILFAIVSFVLALLKKLSPEMKHVVWLFLIYGIVLIPLVSTFFPLFWFENADSSLPSGKIFRTLDILFYPSPIDTAVRTSVGIEASLPGEASAHFVDGTLPFFIVVIWATGVILSSVKVVVGRFRASALCHDEDDRLKSINERHLAQMTKKLGIRRSVSIMTSRENHIPFAYRWFHPLVVLPCTSALWQSEWVRAVLLHELSHIRRGDYLSRLAARILCSLFWFLPPLWIAFSRLIQEQEMACDLSVLRRGVKPSDYAGHMLDLATVSMRKVSLQGSFLSEGRKKTLEKRILHVLQFGRMGKQYKGGRTMKVRNLLLVSTLLLAAIVLIGSCATTKKSISDEDFFAVWSGTWVNTKYPGIIDMPQKVVNHPDGSMEIFNRVNDIQTSIYRPRGKLSERWIDSRGKIWFRASYECPDCDAATGYIYGNVSKSEKTLEFLECLGTITIDEWDPDNNLYYYRVYYRQ
jgi:beta-lactamase regulating signal transducer with metallopeptidase domain